MQVYDILEHDESVRGGMDIAVHNKQMEDMMKQYPNIEKSAVRKGEYVGHQNGTWRITKSNSSYGNWWAVHDEYPRFQIFAWTLDHMSRRLAETTVII